jgi:hypothetical protein
VNTHFTRAVKFDHFGFHNDLFGFILACPPILLYIWPYSASNKVGLNPIRVAVHPVRGKIVIPILKSAKNRESELGASFQQAV